MVLNERRMLEETEQVSLVKKFRKQRNHDFEFLYLL